MGARWYDPTAGAFDSRDAVTYTAGASILANRYTYAAGDPTVVRLVNAALSELNVPPAALFAPVLLPDGTAWAVGAAGEVIRLAAARPQERRRVSTYGLTWLRGMSWLDPRHAWIVGGSGLILRTTDGGATWTPVVA